MTSSYHHNQITTESEFHPPLHPNCDDQIVYAKFSLQTYYPHREVWYSAMEELNLSDVQLNNLFAKNHF